MPKIFFITGVCGAGKTSIISHLKPLLSKYNFEIHDLDERGVPTKAGHSWHLDETKHWLRVGSKNSKKRISTIITGWANPEEFQTKIKTDDDIEILFCLLDASAETIRTRLNGRYKTKKSIKEIERVTGDSIEKFIAHNANFSSTFRKICKDHDCHIIDTNKLGAKEVATKIAEWVKDATI